VSVGPITVVYHAFDHGELVATGRLTLERLPDVGETLTLNGIPYVVGAVEYGGGEHVLTLEAR
jgi:hypothetical protein